MKIIHCADLHLDSAMKTNLTSEKAITRKNELLNTFERLVTFAKEEDVRVIMIAGDLFDGKAVKVKTKSIVRRCISENPDIDFLYLRGNHDENTALFDDCPPENFKCFTSEWTTYTYDNVTITGAELSGKKSLYSSLLLQPGNVNIVMLHGQDADYAGKDKTEVIPLPMLKDKNIDYLALGHIHTAKSGMLDKRGKWQYSGCLDGRGYDECGEKGCYLLTVDGKKIEDTFISFSSRKIETVSVDISDAMDTPDVARLVGKAIGSIPESYMLKVVLTGKVAVETMYDLDYIREKYADRFFAFRIEDDLVGLQFNIDDYHYDASLKGEFIREILASNDSEEDKRLIIETGLRALSGEEV